MDIFIHILSSRISMKCFMGAKIVTENEILEDYILIVKGEKIDLVHKNNFDFFDELQQVNLKDKYIAPGLIDLHIHGSGGYDTMEATYEALNEISKSIVKNGVTSFLATTMTMEKMHIQRALMQVKESMEKELDGAQLLGAHVEGPFINEKYKGAQPMEFILDPVWELLKPYKEVIKIVTLAPEKESAKDLIEKLVKNNIIASMGHTAATYEEGKKGIEYGISHCTHIFNAMSSFHHRNPGAVGAALLSDISCEIIADKIHTHTAVYELLTKTKALGKIILITDCMKAGNRKEGKYELGATQ